MPLSAVAAPDPGLGELDRAECLALLGTVPVGRLVHTVRALPAIVPVPYALLSDGIYLRTAADLARSAPEGDVVAFEADAFDARMRAGWTVVVVGRAVQVSDRSALVPLADPPVLPWAGRPGERLLRVGLELVSGRRLGCPTAT